MTTLLRVLEMKLSEVAKSCSDACLSFCQENKMLSALKTDSNWVPARQCLVFYTRNGVPLKSENEYKGLPNE
eukprot:768221-Hanusia_phi.AAC.9